MSDVDEAEGSSAAEQTGVDANTLARILLLSTRRVEQLAKQGHVERTERGRYALIPSIQGYIRFLNEDVKRGTTDDGLRDAQRRRQIALAERAELELEREKRTVAPLEESRAFFATMVSIVISKLESIERRVTAKLTTTPREREEIRMVIREVREEIADELEPPA